MRVKKNLLNIFNGKVILGNKLVPSGSEIFVLMLKRKPVSPVFKLVKNTA